MTKNEYIASIMLEAAELLKSNYEILNEGYMKDSYDLVKDDFRTIENNMIKANNLRRQSKFDESIKVLTETLEIIKNTKIKVKNMNNPTLLQKIISSIFDKNGYISRKTELKNKAGHVIYVKSRGDSDLKGTKKIIDSFLNACKSDVLSMIALCNKFDAGKIQNQMIGSNADERMYNYKLLKEAIDLLYDKAMECDTLDEATEYINKAEQLESLIDE